MNKQNRADQRKYHFIYKTTNLINAKYYIGMHSTNNLTDGYLGSGTRLWRSIQHYGKENFKVEIQEFLIDRESLRKRELEIVNEEKLKDPLCMNLCKGGYGDFPIQCSIAGGKTNAGNKRKTGNYGWKVCPDKTSLKYRQSVSKGLKERFKIIPHIWTGRKHSEESKKLIGSKNAVQQKGDKNSQFGKMWISNLETKISLSVSNDFEIVLPFVKGRKFGKIN